jgi:hypothetical protein
MTFDTDAPERRDKPFGPALPDAHERPAQLEETVEQLAAAVTSHATVDQAVGIMVGLGKLSPSESWDVLVEVAQLTNIKVRHVAELIVDFGRTGHLCTDIRTELNNSLARRKVTSPGHCTMW